MGGRLGADSSEGAPVKAAESSRELAGRTGAREGGAEETGEGAAEARLDELSARPFLWDLLVSRGHKPKSQLRGGERGWGPEAERKGPPDRGVG